jgi:hypothetical protein
MDIRLSGRLLFIGIRQSGHWFSLIESQLVLKISMLNKLNIE